MFSDAARTSMLDSLAPAFASLHTAFPGQNFANEVTGGSPAYARKGITFGAAASGIRTSTTAPVFDVPATTVAWIAFGTLVSAGVELAVSPNGANPKEFQLSTVLANGIYLPAHGYVANTSVTFYGGTPPTGLTQGTTYYVVGATVATDQFQVSAAPSGAAIALTGAATASCLCSIIAPETFAAQGTFTLAIGATLNLNY